MARWREMYPQDVDDELQFFAQRAAERKAEKEDKARRKAFIKAQRAGPTTISDNDDRWLDELLTTDKESDD
jgi:hypothetical protein